MLFLWLCLMGLFKGPIAVKNWYEEFSAAATKGECRAMRVFGIFIAEAFTWFLALIVTTLWLPATYVAYVAYYGPAPALADVFLMLVGMFVEAYCLGGKTSSSELTKD